jgi:carboxyl-terminal processing protease
MCDYIVPDDMGDGLIVSTKDKNDRVLEEWKLEDGHSVDVPMVVLVNGNSASASEIFTGCMKDYGLATIVGTTTYGKGIVQSVIPLSDGSAIKITIAKYFTPSGNDIHKVGIEPDVEVELPDEVRTLVTIPHDQDTQLQKAIEILTK